MQGSHQICSYSGPWWSNRWSPETFLWSSDPKPMPPLFPTKVIILQTSCNQIWSFQAYQIKYLSTDGSPWYAALQQVCASCGTVEPVPEKSWSKWAYSVAALTWPTEISGIWFISLTSRKHWSIYWFMRLHSLYGHRLVFHYPMSNPPCCSMSYVRFGYWGRDAFALCVLLAPGTLRRKCWSRSSGW